jgi:hypothetical protein
MVGMVFTRVDETHTIQVGTYRVGFVDHKHAGFPDKNGMKHWTITRIELGPSEVTGRPFRLAPVRPSWRYPCPSYSSFRAQS